MHRSAALLLCIIAAPIAHGAADAPLPDVPSLLRSVEQNQEALDRAREQYTFRQQQHIVMYDKKGRVKSTEDKVMNVFFVHGHAIETLVSKDGKALNANDLKKEQDKATKEAVKYAAGPYNAHDKDGVSVSQLLVLAKFTHPRRVLEGGRSLIAVDFTGDPHAKSSGRAESAIKHTSGTVWIDERAREVRRLEATVDDPLHIGFGLLATINPGSHFRFEQALINDEVWLPTSFAGRFDARLALFVGFHVEVQGRFDEYKRYQASTTEATEPPVAK